MKAMKVGLWSVWLYGFLLILFSLYASQRLPSFRNEIKRPPSFSLNRLFDAGGPSITIFTAPAPFICSTGARQNLAIRSWLALSSKVNVVLFSQDPSSVSFAEAFGFRVLVDRNIDFTFLGTPFFHSMVERSRVFTADISVFINSETIILTDLISTLNNAYKLDYDWLLLASLRNVSRFPFQLDDTGKHWQREDGKWIRPRELQEEILGQDWHWNHCQDKILMAWNSRNLPLYNGVLPPFLYGKGIHNHWVINEAVSSELRFIFDASWAISSFFLNNAEHWSNQSVKDSHVLDRSWEDVGNSHLGSLYGSLFFNEVNYSSLTKLLKCNGAYHFVGTAEDIAHPFVKQGLGLWDRKVLHTRKKKKYVACVDDTISQHRLRDCFVKDQLKTLAPLDFPFSLGSLLSVTADQNKTIVLAVAGNSYKDMLMSWVCRLRHLLVTNFLICALDDETFQFSVLQGLPVFHDPSAPKNVSFDDCHFGTECFQRVTKVKSRIVLKILKLGYNVLMSDVDVYWFQNPLPLLSSFGPAVLAAQSDEYNITGPVNLPRRLNSGFYFARSDSSTITAIEKVVKHAVNSGLSEQPSFYDILCGEGGSNRISDNRCIEPEANLTTHFLDRDLFPNGAYLDLWQSKNVKDACMKKGCLILHNNWISGRLKKLERQVLSGLWEYDSSKRMCLQSAELVTLEYSIDLPAMRSRRHILDNNYLLKHSNPLQQLSPHTLLPVNYDETFESGSFLLSAMPSCLICTSLFGIKNPRKKAAKKKDLGVTTKREECSGAPVSLDSSSQSEVPVRIVHAGGKEELYQCALPASQLMEKYPGLCVARPGVFENPQESLLWPDELLLPGYKYILIPSTTARKVERKHMRNEKGRGSGDSRDVMLDANVTSDESADTSDEHLCSAKDFYACKDEYLKSVVVKRKATVKKPFVPPLPSDGPVRGSPWEPRLTSVQELSP